jgi:transposase
MKYVDKNTVNKFRKTAKKMTTEERRRRRFSASFRREQVKLIETGKATIIELSRLYEVRPDNVRKWVKKFGTKKAPETIIITNSSEINRLKNLEKENLKLKQIIGEQQVRLIYLEQLTTLAKDQLGDEFEKK